MLVAVIVYAVFDFHFGCHGTIDVFSTVTMHNHMTTGDSLDIAVDEIPMLSWYPMIWSEHVGCFEANTFLATIGGGDKPVDVAVIVAESLDLLHRCCLLVRQWDARRRPVRAFSPFQ